MLFSAEVLQQVQSLIGYYEYEGNKKNGLLIDVHLAFICFKSTRL